MTEPVLRLENVNKKVSDFFTLKNINLELREGEVHALIGENGSGKTSLMHIITGTCTKDSGNIYLNGSLVNINSSIDANRLGITMTHQEPSLFENLSIAENIYFDTNQMLSKFSLKTINWAKINSDCQKLFKKLNFNLDAQKLVKYLGIAQKQLVEIIKAYASNARIILMDEPTASLTESESSFLFNIIRELKSNGVSIIFISHRLEEIRLICDKISVIRDGEIIGTQDVFELDTFKLINMMTGHDIKDRYPKLELKVGKEILRVSGLSSGSTLNEINFSLGRREILGITGLVGSGRTKLAKSIFGCTNIDSGEIYIEGKKVNIKSPFDAIKEGIGYVSEDRQLEGLFMYLKIFENISTPSLSKLSSKYGIDLEKEKDIVNAFVEKIGIKAGTIYNNAESLSGGNQQKVVLAKWMMTKSKIFILDEPTRGIDIASKVDVYNVMNELVRKGASIILISSDISEVIGMCDRTMVLYGGKIAKIVPRIEATQENIIYYATGGK